MTPTFRLFMAGWIMSRAVDYLYQDALGKEKYLGLIATAWVDPVITVPLAIILGGVALAMQHSAKKDLGY